MKQVLLAKLDTPCTLDTKVMHVPTAEPLNFAYAYCDAQTEPVQFSMLGLENASKLYIANGIKHTIEIVPYFGNPSTLASTVDEDTLLIIWQGRHIIDIRLPEKYDAPKVSPSLSCPQTDTYFEKISFLKSWQVQMYNLISSNACKDAQKCCIITDIRLPFIDLHKVDSSIVTKPLPKDIMLWSQAYHHEAYMKYHNKWGHGIMWPECDNEDYLYQFKNSMYLPLHVLPIWSHDKVYQSMLKGPFKDFERKQKAVFQTQSIKYLDDYRIKQLKQCVADCQGEAVFMGRFGDDERGVLVSKFPKWSDKIECLGSKTNALPFYEAAKELWFYAKSMVITDGRYARYGLVPNRLAEALAMRCKPMIADEVLTYCDPAITEQLQQFADINFNAGVDTYSALLKDMQAQLTSVLRDIDTTCTILSHTK